MTSVVLVHGIAQEQKSADLLESEWLPALTGGVRTALGDVTAEAFKVLASRDCRMAFYGDLFLTSDVQGSREAGVDRRQAALVEALAMEWLERAALRSSRARNRALAQHELAAMQLAAEEVDVQGPHALARPLLQALARVPWFASLGVGFASRFVIRALRQVTSYFTDEEIREACIDRVLSRIGPDTRVVIAHSLGTVVAYEALHRSAASLPLLITLGSPLGLRTVVYERLRPQPPAVPSIVRQWINAADRDDLVAADLDLRAALEDKTGVVQDCLIVDNGSRPHDATHYLSKKELAGSVAGAALGGTL
ncbi:hypothetical protein ACFQ7I_28800 [Streptomyces massasporeus]